MKRNMFARAEARQLGEKHYHTGIPCKQGHIGPRATATGTCVECTNTAVKAWVARNKERAAGYSAAYRAKNAELVREKDKLAQSTRRAANPDYFKAYRQARYKDQVQELHGRDVRPYNVLPLEDMVARLKKIHAGTLEYVSGYAGVGYNAVFQCAKHSGTFRVLVHNVLRGANPCTQCNHTKSKGEAEVAKFLGIFTPVVSRDREVLKPRELDVFLPEKQLAVEYCGMFWHSFGDAKNAALKKHNHFHKYQDCASKGIRLLTIYESEWQENSKVIKRLLRNAIGKMRGRLMARKCELGKPEFSEVRAFFNKYHPQGGAGAGEHYGLFWKGKLVACMRFSLGVNDRGAAAGQRVWTLSRYATRLPVVGGASRLFKAFLKDAQPTEVKSFSDNRYFSGGMYEQLGFVLEEDVAPDYQVWSPKIGLRPKPHYQRRVLPRRLREHGMDGGSFDPATDPRSEAEMTYLMGARRIFDCGKKRWVYCVDISSP